MHSHQQHSFSLILKHIEVCERRFDSIKKPEDFISTMEGEDMLDAIVSRLQAISENIKRIVKLDDTIKEKYPLAQWDNIIRFRDFVSHHYELLDYEIVFNICKVNLPELKEIALKEVNS